MTNVDDLDAANESEFDQLGMASCENLIPGLPAPWYGWPLGISVGFALTPNTCVYRKLFQEYTVNSMEQALDTLFAKGNENLFIGYRFYADGFLPSFEYFAAWPLQRRGRDEPTEIWIGSWFTQRMLERGIRRRELVGGAAPWEEVSDDTVFEIWHEPVNVYGSRTALMLRVGGRDQAEAGSTWALCAKALRKYRRTAPQAEV
jgi:hypothetical protein